MSSRFQRPTGRAPVAPVHRGPQALPPGASSAPAPYGAFNMHAPNAALLIDFDNVTMGIQKDMQAELRNLMSSDIIKGKVSVQRAYADWRRYPGYIVPLTEASIDLIFAPAYGSAKKNATDIRLAIDAMELVFTRPEIGTYILLSGDSDFSSLVIKLKEYGKYVIGVGIRESSSDLLVQNCDEYYSYNALAGLVRTSDEEIVRWDPWELVTEAIGRMSRNGDVMRADRLKQVMQDIDPSFDEKDLGMSKFSRFVHEAEKRGLVTVTRLENGQYEIGAVGASSSAAPATAPVERPRRDDRRPAEIEEPSVDDGAESRDTRAPRDERGRPRRSRRGRGRDFERPRAETGAVVEPGIEQDNGAAQIDLPDVATPVAPTITIGVSGERLTRSEAFDLVRRAVESLVEDDVASVGSATVRERARDLLGRDSESLNERMFERILRDASDAKLVDLRRRGDAYELGRSAHADSVADQLNRAAAAPTAPTVSASGASILPRGMGPRGAGARGRPGAPPPGLLSVGVVRVDSPASSPEASPEPLGASDGVDAPEPAIAAQTPAETAPAAVAAEQPDVALEDGGTAAAETSPATAAPARSRGGRGRGGRKTAAQDRSATPTPAAKTASTPAPATKQAPAAAPAPAAEASGSRGGRRKRGGARKAPAAPATPAAAAAAAPAPATPARPARTPSRTPAAAPAPEAPAASSATPAVERRRQPRGGGSGATKTAARTAAPSPAPAAASTPAPAAESPATGTAESARPRRPRRR